MIGRILGVEVTPFTSSPVTQEQEGRVDLKLKGGVEKSCEEEGGREKNCGKGSGTT